MDLAKIGLAVESKGLKDGIRNLRQLEGEGARTERGMSKLKGTVAAVSAAFAALGAQAFARDIIREADQLNRNLLRTQQLIDTTGRNAERSAQSMREQARQIALATLQSTEGVMQAQQTLLTFRNITGETFDQAIAGAVDLSSAMGQDLNSSVLQLGKALEDPVKGLTALSRSGTVFTDAQREMVKGMVETNRTAEAQQFILGELAAQYGGVAQAESQGLAGAQDTLGQRIQEAKLELADQLNLIENGVTAYNVMSNAALSLTDNMDNVIQVTQALTVLIGSRLAAALATATAAKIAAAGAALRLGGAATAATASVSALRGALALLGGPIGLLIGAGGLLYVFREELGLVQRPAVTAAGAVDELRLRVDEASDSMLAFEVAAFTAEMVSLEVAAEQAQESIDRIKQAASEPYSYGQGQQGDLNAGLERQEAQLESLNNQIAARQQAIEKLNARTEQLNGTQDDNGDSNRTLEITVDGLNESTDDAAESAENYANELDSLRRSLDPAYARSQDFAQATALLDRALVKGSLTLTEYLALWDAAAERMIDAEGSTRDLADTTTDAADEMSREWERFGNSVDDTFKDAFKGAFDSFDDFADQLKGAFENLLAELAYAAVKNEIKIQLGMGTSGPMSGGIGDIGSGAQSLFSRASNLPGVGNTIAKAGTALGFGSAGTAAGYSGALGAATSTGYGGALGSAVSGASAAGGGVMGAVGSAVPWIGGALAIDSLFGGEITGAISKGLFGGSWEPTGKGGVELGVGDEGVTGRNFAEERKSGGLFSGSSYKDVFSDLDADFENQLADTYAAQLAAAEGAFMALGEETAGTVLDSFTAGLERIRTDNKSEEEVSQAINNWLSSTLNSAVSGVDGAGAAAQFARSGEGISDTVIRLGTALQAFNETVVRVKDNALDASYASGDAADSIIQMAGGVESLSTLTDYYFNNILSSEERIQKASDSGVRALGRFSAATGEVVNTSGELKALVDGLDLTTDAGQRLYAEALKVAPALQDVEKGLESVSAQFQSSIDSMSAAVSSAEDNVKRLYDAFMDQAFDQQLTLLEAAGDEQAALNLQREKELESIDPLLHETQRFIWQLEDEAQAKQSAAKAGQQYAQEIESIQGQLDNTFNSINQWIDKREGTTGTPSKNLGETGRQFAEQLKAAQAGDRSALQSITQYADAYLSAGETMFASGSEFQKLQADVISNLEELPEQISSEEYLAQEIRDALREATQGISTNLSDVLRGDNPSNIAQALAQDFDALAGGIDGVLTREQLGVVMQGKATDAQLGAVMRAVDLNGDGVMDGLESVIIQSLPTDAVLGSVLRNKMNELDKNQLTHAQIRNALSPIATDAEIDRLIREVDVNGDGIISAEELTASRVSGIAGGVAASLSSSFSMLDKNLDDNLTFGELRAGLKGIATDAQIRTMMRTMDLNNDGVISKLESVVIESMPNDARLTNVLRSNMQALGRKTLTRAQVKEALSPIATDAEIDRLIKEVDANGDGIITKQELANQRLSGLASGIGSALAPMFDSIDLSTDGLIDWGEFYGAFRGLASDDQLKSIYAQLDANGDDQISELEALNASSDGTEDNTKSLEERAYDQLRELGGLVGEMTRTTDQFVGLNSGIASLSESINALGVAQEEVARIEQERAAAEKAERERIEQDRKEAIAEARRQKELQERKSLLESQLARSEKGIETHWENAVKASRSVQGNIVQQVTGSSQYQNIRAMMLEDEGIISQESIQEALSSARGAFDGAAEKVAQELLRQVTYQRSLNVAQSGLNSLPEFANGGAFTNSIVSSPTAFDMGVMGEAGPEAIMPLERGPGGALGVRMWSAPTMLGGNDVRDVLSDMRQELQALRRENSDLQSRIADNTGGTAGAVMQGNQQAERQRDTQIQEQRRQTRAQRIKERN